MAGSIVIRENPVILGEKFHLTLRGNDEYTGGGIPVFFGYQDDDRSFGGFWSCTFRIRADEVVLSEMFENGLGRGVHVYGEGLRTLHEGFVYEMVYNLPPNQYTSSLQNMWNKARMRTDYDDDGAVERSTIINNLDSQAKYGTKTIILSGGETSSLTVANQAVQQYINIRGFPIPEPDIGGGSGEAYLEVFCRGYIETLKWPVYNQTANTGNVNMSQLISDVIGKRASTVVLRPTVWDDTMDWEEGDTSDADSTSGSPSASIDAARDGSYGLSLSLAASSLRDSMISWWELNETSGNRADSHGSNTLTDNNTVGNGTGKQGNAADFEISNSEYLSIPNASAADLLFGDESFALSLWLKPESQPSTYNHVVSVYNTSGNQRSYSIVYKSTGDGISFLISNDGSSFTQLNWGSGVSNGTWYHIYAGYDADNNEAFLSVDNGALKTTAHASGANASSTADFNIGGRDGSGEDTDGLVDEVGVWGRKLTSLERDELYNSGNGITYAASDISISSPQYVVDTSPASETEYTREVWVDPSGLSWATDDEFVLMVFHDGSNDVARLVMGYDGSDVYAYPQARTDGGSYTDGGKFTLDPVYTNLIRMSWLQSGGSDDGQLWTFLNNTPRSVITGVDNDTLSITEYRAGAVSGLDAGTSGTLKMDTDRGSDDAVFEVTAESGVCEFIDGLDFTGNATLVTQEYDADLRPFDIIQGNVSLGDSANRPWTFYIVEGRKAVLKVAAPPEVN